MNLSNSVTSSLISIQSGTPQDQLDKTAKTGDVQIPCRDGGHSVPDTVSLSDRTVTRVDVKPEFTAHKALPEVPDVFSQPDTQPGTIAETTPDALTSRFQMLCNSDDGDDLVLLLSGTDAATRRKWFSSPLSFSEKNDTPMMYAARHGNAAVVAALIHYQANPCEINPLSTLQFNALIIAAQENQVKVIQEMVKSREYHPDKPRGDGVTAMFVAIEKGHPEITKILLEHNADPNYKIRYGHYDGAWAHIGSFERQEAIPSCQMWITPVMLAAKHGNVIILEQLLSKHGNTNNIDPANPIQHSPLQEATISAENAKAEMINLLLKCQANMHELIVPGRPCKDVTDAKKYFRPTLFETACFSAEFNNDPQSDRISETYCDYYRTAEGKQVESFILRSFCAGQYFLKTLALQNFFCFIALTNPSVKLYLIRTLRSLNTLVSVLRPEDSSESQIEKTTRAINYAKKKEHELTEDIDNANTAILQDMVKSELEKFNDYNMDFNDEAVAKYLKYNAEIESKSSISQNTSIETKFLFIFISSFFG